MKNEKIIYSDKPIKYINYKMIKIILFIFIYYKFKNKEFVNLI